MYFFFLLFFWEKYNLEVLNGEEDEGRNIGGSKEKCWGRTSKEQCASKSAFIHVYYASFTIFKQCKYQNLAVFNLYPYFTKLLQFFNFNLAWFLKNIASIFILEKIILKNNSMQYISISILTRFYEKQHYHGRAQYISIQPQDESTLWIYSMVILFKTHKP